MGKQRQEEHNCKYESRWNNFYNWRETVNNFIAGKEETNGHLKLEDQKLEKRLSGIESKMWGLLITMIGFMFAIIAYTVLK
jgi:hypothetical protein